MAFAIGKLLLLVLDICFWIIIIQVALSWLIVFNVVNVNNPQIRNLVDLLQKATEPVYKPLRKFIPPIGGIDITPIIIIFAITILQGIVQSMFMGPQIIIH